MSEYYRDELLHFVRNWNPEQLDFYIQELEQRIVYTKDNIRMLRNLKRRKLKNKNAKDTGERGGK